MVDQIIDHERVNSVRKMLAYQEVGKALKLLVYDSVNEFMLNPDNKEALLHVIYVLFEYQEVLKTVNDLAIYVRDGDLRRVLELAKPFNDNDGQAAVNELIVSTREMVY